EPRFEVALSRPFLSLEKYFNDLSANQTPFVNNFTARLETASNHRGTAALGGIYFAQEMRDKSPGKPSLSGFLPQSIGFADAAGVFHRIFRRPCRLPARVQKKLIISGSPPPNSDYTLHLFQGERRIARDNIPIGTFVFC